MEMIKANDNINMTTVEIAEQTGKRHDNVMADTKKMLVEIYGEDSLLKFQESYKSKNGQVYDCYRLPKKEVLVLVSGYSAKLRMKIITRLEELETGRSNPYANEIKKDSFEMELLGLKYSSDILRCSDVSRLQMVHAVYKNNGVPTTALPQCIEKTRVTFSAKDLLKKNDCGISTIAFNKLMMGTDFMEERERASTKSKNGVKTFKVLTDAGLKYGQNDTSLQNPRETQPHYYEDSFRFAAHQKTFPGHVGKNA